MRRRNSSSSCLSQNCPPSPVPAVKCPFVMPWAATRCFQRGPRHHKGAFHRRHGRRWAVLRQAATRRVPPSHHGVLGAWYSRFRHRPMPAFWPAGNTARGDTQLAGVEGLRQVMAQLAGVALPLEAWERQILPARLPGFDPEDLADLCRSGDLVWSAVGNDGRVADGMPRDPGRVPRNPRVRSFAGAMAASSSRRRTRRAQGQGRGAEPRAARPCASTSREKAPPSTASWRTDAA